MKKILAMMIGSGGSSLLNLIALTIAVSRINLSDLDVYFIYRDAAESVLKLLFVSQIGPVCIAVLAASKSRELLLRKIILLGGVLAGLILCLWALVFDHFSEFFLKPDSVNHINNWDYLVIAILVFCCFTWIDAVVTTILVQARLFLQNHSCNFLSASFLCFFILSLNELSVSAMALSYAVSKVLGVLSKIFICFTACSEWLNTLRSYDDSMKVITSESRNVFSRLFIYAPLNVFQQINKFVYLAGATFLQPGHFALYSIYYRYYTALQNLITVNIFNLSAFNLTDSASSNEETVKLIFRHVISFAFLYCCAAVVMLCISVVGAEIDVPVFLVGPYASLLWSGILLNFLPDGINFILSRRGMLQDDLKSDSRINFCQTIANLIILYPSMRFFGLVGLVCSTALVCFTFSMVRLLILRRVSCKFNSLFYRSAVYFLFLFTLSLTSLLLPSWIYCALSFLLGFVMLYDCMRLFRRSSVI